MREQVPFVDVLVHGRLAENAAELQRCNRQQHDGSDSSLERAVFECLPVRRYSHHYHNHSFAGFVIVPSGRYPL